MDESLKRHLAILIGVAVAVKIFTILLTNSLHSFVDVYDYSYYFEHMAMIVNGKVPYVDFPFDYPVLAIIPMLLAFAISGMNISVYILVFQFFMIVCDALTILGIYAISSSIWGNKKRAFIAGLLYACSLPIAYFTLTKFDALPTMIIVWAIAYALLGRSKDGYQITATGTFTKVFPGIAAPFLFLWSIKGSGWKLDAAMLAGIFILYSSILILPFLLLGAKITDIFTVLTRGEVYPNTPAYLLHTLTGISAEAISAVMFFIAVFIFGILLAKMWKGRKSPVLLIEVITVALIITVFSAALHSPQYMMWYTPFLCLLVGSDLILIGLLVLTHLLAYIEFPLLFGSVWTNAGYVNNGVAIGLFGAEYLTMLLLLIMIISKNRASFSNSIN